MSCYLTDAVAAALNKIPDRQTIWIALSGGLDSTVLLHLAASFPQFKNRLKAIHVHHGLSVNADHWLNFCQTLCDELAVPFIAEKVEVNKQGQGLEQAARQARYQVFSHYLSDNDHLLMAHHGDDQIETFFIRLLRGAGLTGLAAMSGERQHQHFHISRPLLSCRRWQLEQYAEQHQLVWIEDESNQDIRFDRNWWRQQLLPQIFKRFPRHQSSLLRSVEQLQQDRVVLQQLLQPKLEACCEASNWPFTYGQSLKLEELMQQPENLRPYIFRRWLELAGVKTPSAIQLQSVFAEMFTAAEDKQPQYAIDGWTLQRFKQQLYLYQSTTAQLSPLPFLLKPDDHRTALRWSAGFMVADRAEVGLEPGQYRLVNAGDVAGKKIRPLGRPAKTFKHLWQENGIPPWLRPVWPCVVNDDGELVAVVGLAIDQAFCKEQGYSLRWSGQENK